MIQKILLNNIRVLRAHKRLTQEQLATAVSVSRKTINAIEGGDYSPSVLLALAIAEALEVPVEQAFQLGDKDAAAAA